MPNSIRGYIMNLSRIVLAGGLLAGMVVGGSSAKADVIDAPAATPPVTWHTGTSAVIHGSGCNGTEGSATQDAWAIANGSDLSIIFTNMGVELPGIPVGTVEGDHALSGRKNCSIR